MVLNKGSHWYSLTVLLNHILWLGYTRIKLRSDGEPAIRGLFDELTPKLKEKGIEVVPDKTPKGDSNAGGMQESSVKQFKDKCRAIWMYACELHGVNPAENHALIPWAAQYRAS